MEILIGRLALKGEDFTFVFDGKLLKLVPDDKEIVFSWTHKEIGHGVFTTADLPRIESSFLVGECKNTGQTVAFLFYEESRMWYHYETFFAKPKAYIIIKCKRGGVDRLGFTCPELNCIYPVGAAYQLSITEDALKNGTYAVESKPFDTHTTPQKSFVYQGERINVKFSISKSIHSWKKNPIEFSSALFFIFEETNDYEFVYRLSLVALHFLQFLCGRENISFESIALSCPYGKNEHEQFAELIMIRDVTEEDEKTVEKKYIPYHCFSGYENIILQMISDNTLYSRHIPQSEKKGHTIDAATFVMITAAFEWEFRKLYPNGVRKKEKKLAAEKSISELIETLILEKKGTEKTILKHLKKQIGQDYLAEEINFVGKELFEIIDPFGQHIYKMNNQKLKYAELGERLARQRNNFAHGNLDKEFEGLALLDIVFLKRIVYAMQLKRVGLSDDNIKNAINTLFNENLYFGTNNTTEKNNNNERKKQRKKGRSKRR